MNSSKRLVGYVPSVVINQMLRRRGLSGPRLLSVLNIANSYPNWLASVDELVLVETKFGFSLWCDRRDIVGQTIAATGQWEGLLSRTIQACLRPGDVAIDIGANIGYDSMLMSGAVRKDGLVIAYEPVLRNLNLLLRNVALLPAPNVVVQSIALSDTPGFARIALGDQGNMGLPNLRPGEKGESQPIIVTRFDQLIAPGQFDRIRLVKMDVEGFEFRVLRGFGDWIDRVDCLIVEISPGFLNQCGSNPAEVFAHMENLGFTSYCSEPNSDESWVASGPDYKIQATGSVHFDALFCRPIIGSLSGLIREGV